MDFDFGKTLIGVVGYGFALLMVAASVTAFWELIQMRGRTDNHLGNEKAKQAVICAILAFGAAMFTRWTLGWI